MSNTESKFTEEEYREYREIGERIFALIGDDLNNISDSFIRKETTEFRREQDFTEIAIALTLFALLLNLDVENL